MGRYRKYFKIYRKMQEMNIKSLMYYRADFLMMTFFTLLSQVSNLAVVGIIYTNIPTVGGWSYGKFYCYMDICYFQKAG